MRTEKPGRGCGKLGEQNSMSKTQNMLWGTSARDGDMSATLRDPHTLGEVSSMPSWARCPPPRDPDRPRTWAGALAGGWARSPWLFSEASSEAAVSPGRKKQDTDGVGPGAKGQLEGLLPKPLPPTLLRKLAEVGFISAEVRPARSSQP